MTPPYSGIHTGASPSIKRTPYSGAPYRGLPPPYRGHPTIRLHTGALPPNVQLSNAVGGTPVMVKLVGQKFYSQCY